MNLPVSQSSILDRATPALTPARQGLFYRRGFARSPGERENRSPLLANSERLDSSKRGAWDSLSLRERGRVWGNAGPARQGHAALLIAHHAPRGRGSRTRFAVAASGFTMIEIAIALGVIGFALVAIIGILPSGLE